MIVLETLQENKEMAKAKTKETEEKKIDKNAPIYSFEISVADKEDKRKKTKYRIALKKPTRTLLSDADMYYSIRLSTYIKMGLLTAEQIAKRQVDVGGTFTDEQQKHYAKLQSLIGEKQEMLLRLMAKKDLSPDEEERKRALYDDTAMLRSQAMDYEYIKNQVYEHTANAKARNDVILWWVLNLATIQSVDEEGAEVKVMFQGENFETKKMSLEEMEDSEDGVLEESFTHMIKAVTLWYWMGIGNADKIQELLASEENA